MTDLRIYLDKDSELWIERDGEFVALDTEMVNRIFDKCRTATREQITKLFGPLVPWDKLKPMSQVSTNATGNFNGITSSTGYIF